MVLYPTIYEGFGLPLTEAFDRGTPAIASDIPVLREIGEGAVRFATKSDTDRWREAVLELAGSPAARATLREAGLKRAGELTYRRTAELTRGFIREAAGRP
jgi:alpha-1,3-rhamnosyl/mannosyltransferase